MEHKLLTHTVNDPRHVNDMLIQSEIERQSKFETSRTSGDGASWTKTITNIGWVGHIILGFIFLSVTITYMMHSMINNAADDRRRSMDHAVKATESIRDEMRYNTEAMKLEMRFYSEQSREGWSKLLVQQKELIELQREMLKKN